jgi:hypothetical protein
VPRREEGVGSSTRVVSRASFAQVVLGVFMIDLFVTDTCYPYNRFQKAATYHRMPEKRSDWLIPAGAIEFSLL